MRFSTEEKEEEKGEISWFVVGCPEGLDMFVSCASGQSCPRECFPVFVWTKIGRCVIGFACTSHQGQFQCQGITYKKLERKYGKEPHKLSYVIELGRFSQTK